MYVHGDHEDLEVCDTVPIHVALYFRPATHVIGAQFTFESGVWHRRKSRILYEDEVLIAASGRIRIDAGNVDAVAVIKYRS